jgi:hypothetical protein
MQFAMHDAMIERNSNIREFKTPLTNLLRISYTSILWNVEYRIEINTYRQNKSKERRESAQWSSFSFRL